MPDRAKETGAAKNIHDPDALENKFFIYLE